MLLPCVTPGDSITSRISPDHHKESYEIHADLHVLSDSIQKFERFEETRIPQVISHNKLDGMECDEFIPEVIKRELPARPEVQANASSGELDKEEARRATKVEETLTTSESPVRKKPH